MFATSYWHMKSNATFFMRGMAGVNEKCGKYSNFHVGNERYIIWSKKMRNGSSVSYILLLSLEIGAKKILGDQIFSTFQGVN